MKRIVIFLLFILLLTSAGTASATCLVKGPGLPGIGKKILALPPAAMQYLLRMTPHDYTVATGKKLNWKDKLALQVYKWKLAKHFRDEGKVTERQKKLATLSLIFGAGAFVLLLVPLVGVLAVPSAIAGIVLGIMSLKGNRNTNGILGIVFGAAFLFLVALVIALFVLLANGFW